jgi:hypothetical protein
MTVTEAISAAEALLPGKSNDQDDLDLRWQAIISVADFVETEAATIWPFVERWGSQSDEDLRAAIATCLLEHLLEHHFDELFPKVEAAVIRSAEFADTFSLCGQFGQAKQPEKAARFAALQRRCRCAS